jgi:hypothetical protein
MICVISGFLCELDENCVILVFYAASSVNSVPTFRNNLSVTSPSVSPILKGSLKMGPTLGDGAARFPATSVRNYHLSLCKKPEERSSHNLT